MSGQHRFSPPADNGLFSGPQVGGPPRPQGGAEGPADPAAEDAAGAEAVPPPGLRVLVVDDNPVNLMVLSAQLAAHGVVPLLAADGAQGVALACGPPFDLILMDLQMPLLAGFGATEAIRRFEASVARPAVPVLAYSTSSPAPGVLARHGLNGSLPKPCTERDLDDCLRQWCPGHRPMPQRQGAPADLSFAQQQPDGRVAAPDPALRSGPGRPAQR